MIEAEIGTVAAFGADDIALPFHVAQLDTRGRAVRLGPMLDTLLARHAYPLVVERLLAEAITLAALMGSSLKFEGRFQLQTRTQGAVSMLVVDFTPPGDLRAYAQFDAERVAAAPKADSAALLGEGVLAFTIEQTVLGTRYQGIVPLEEQGLTQAALGYFTQSEQIPTALRLAVAEHHVPGHGRRWRAGGVLAQYLPTDTQGMRDREASTDREAPATPLKRPAENGETSREAETLAAKSAHPRRDTVSAQQDTDKNSYQDSSYQDSWREAEALVHTTEDIEMVDPELGLDRLLYRLFNQRGVSVQPPVALRDQCSCSPEKFATSLRGFTAQDLDGLAEEDGAFAITCEFCARAYRVTL